MKKLLYGSLPVIFWSLVISLINITFGFEIAVLTTCVLVLSKLK